MPRHLVFIGNCQTDTLAVLYRAIVAPRTGERVSYLASYLGADAAAAATVASADVVVRQVLDFAPRTDELEAQARSVLVPLIAAPFLWPCSGRAHPRNAPAPYLDPSGPYDAELGDSFLDRMIAREVPAEAAVAEYLATDIVALRHVDRMQEISLQRQRAREHACGGYGLTDAILARLGREKLFRTVNHPERALTLLLAAEVFERIGVPAECLDALPQYPGPLFPATEAPIHPGIARHFGLSYGDAAARYRFFDEGRFTFAEYAYRYMNYEWNPDLPHGLHLAHSGYPLQAILLLRQAVAASPGSATGHAVLGDLLAAQGRPEEATACARRALELEPDNAHYQGRYAHLRSLTESAQ
jgi:tetratricopeptide (TPR) repeat protein